MPVAEMTSLNNDNNSSTIRPVKPLPSESDLLEYDEEIHPEPVSNNSANPLDIIKSPMSDEVFDSLGEALESGVASHPNPLQCSLKITKSLNFDENATNQDGRRSFLESGEGSETVGNSNNVREEEQDDSSDKSNSSDVPPSVIVKFRDKEYTLFDPTDENSLFNTDDDIDMMYLSNVNQFIYRIKSHWSLNEDVSVRFSELDNLELSQDSKFASEYSLSVLQNLQDLLMGSSSSNNFRPLVAEIIVHKVNTTELLAKLIEKARFVFDTDSVNDNEEIQQSFPVLESDQYESVETQKRKFETLDSVEPSQKKLRNMAMQKPAIATI